MLLTCAMQLLLLHPSLFVHLLQFYSIYVLMLVSKIVCFSICISFFDTGTGNVLKIQTLLHLCSEYYGEDKESEEKEGEVKKPATDDSEAASGKLFLY